jgi:hypothetical protein
MPTPITGTVRISGPVSPFNVEDTYPATDPQYGLGGLRTVGTTTDMEAISSFRRQEGMIVYVSGITAYYALIGTTANSGWTTGFTFGSGGGGGGIVGDYVTTFNGLTGAVQGVSAAIAGDGITLSAATGSVTITNTGVTFIVAGSFIGVSGATGTVTIINQGVQSFNGITGEVSGTTLGGVNVWTNLNTFNAGISAAGATLGSLVVFSGISANGGATFGGLVTAVNGITASGATLGILDVSGNASIGGTLSVTGNFYVAGTLTTVNETQLLIQDKYLVLGSTLALESQADGAGIYVGSTTSAIAGICYSSGPDEWSSSHSFNIPSGSFYRISGNDVLASTYLGSVVTGSSLASVGTLTNGVWNASIIGLEYGGTNKNLSSAGVSGGLVFKTSNSLDVLTSAGDAGQYLKSNGANSAPSWASFSALTGLTADKIKTTATNASGTYYLTFTTGASDGADLYVDTTTGITFNPATDTLSCVKIEAMVDGGTW